MTADTDISSRIPRIDPREPGDILELQIDRVAYGGRGVGRSDGKVIFVPGVLPGESVQVRICRDRPNYAEAALRKVNSASSARRAPICPLVAANCPGCAYPHAAYAEELRMKDAQFKELLSRQAGVELRDSPPPVGSPSEFGYRNKMVLHAVADGSERRLGYFLEDNETVIDVPRCPLAMEPLNELLHAARQKPGFLHGMRNGTRITFRFTQTDGALWWRGVPDETETWLKEETVMGVISVPRRCFFQVNPAVADVLHESVGRLIAGSAASGVVDLYCGVGAFALGAARAGKAQIIGIDSDASAIQAAHYNMRDCGGRATFIAADVGRALPGVLNKIEPRDTILIADPPRSGLERRVLEAIAASGAAEIVYISCAADTLARDVSVLVKAGYEVVSGRVLDMFPRTPYFESITHLRLA